jgi:hypothetical protein
MKSCTPWHYSGVFEHKTAWPGDFLGHAIPSESAIQRAILRRAAPLVR